MLYPPNHPNHRPAVAPRDLLRVGDELLTVLNRWDANEAVESGVQGELAAAALELARLLFDELAPTDAPVLALALGPELDLRTLDDLDLGLG